MSITLECDGVDCGETYEEAAGRLTFTGVNLATCELPEGWGFAHVGFDTLLYCPDHPELVHSDAF
jgi:hypothetical protein